MLLLDQVLRRNEAQQRAVGVDERQLLDLARDHQSLGILERNRSDADDELRARRHPIGHERLGADEPDVALGQQARETPRLVDHRQRADAGARHDPGGLAHPAACRNRVRIRDGAVLAPLDGGDLEDLRLDLAGTKATVDDPDPALLREHDRHRGARDRVHVRGDDRTLDRQMLGKARRQVDEVGGPAGEHAALRRQQEIVEGAAANEVEQIHFETAYLNSMRLPGARASRHPRRQPRDAP